MTPEARTEEAAGQFGDGAATRGENHLTGEEFGELMAGTTEAAGDVLAQAEAHLLVCEQCSAELASLREAICFYREASSAYADEELRKRPRWILPARSTTSRSLVPAYWATAAAMFLIALLPMQVIRRHSAASAAASVSSVAASNAAGSNAQSDEALLEDVNSEISASVPSSMQALADPNNDGTAASNATSDTTSNQRKD
jgi:anti-sigma factor RsiW